MKKIIMLGIWLCSWGILSAGAEEAEQTEPTAEQIAYYQHADELWNAMEKKTGRVELAGGVASLDVPEDFFYLNPKDSQALLEQIWGNPPGEPLLGMIFPAGSTPLDGQAWGVTIEYSEDGYVSDEDADDINYNDLLEDMQQGTREASKERVAAGYEPIELVGWAATPYYDKTSHKMHWAKEIRFGDGPDNTLNYNIRVLGRKGVLVLNFIAGMDQLDMINSKLDSVLAMADFNSGSTYADFNPDMDTVAAYGIGALVAGKVLAKSGLIAALLIFLKKFGIILVVGIGAFFKKLFNKSS